MLKPVAETLRENVYRDVVTKLRYILTREPDAAALIDTGELDDEIAEAFADAWCIHDACVQLQGRLMNAAARARALAACNTAAKETA